MARALKGVEITAKVPREAARLLTPAALNFLAGLQRAYMAGLSEEPPLLEERSQSRAIRDGTWKIAALPRELQDLRGVMVMPTHRKAVINGLNSGAKAAIADFADMTVPVWENLLAGQINLMDRWTSAMEHVDAAAGKRTALGQRLASLVVRPRGLMQDEPRVKAGGKLISAGLFDAGLYLFHNARTALAKASAPYLCLAGIGTQAQARLWNDLIIRIQSDLGLPLGTIRVLVMIDSLPAAFAIDEIVFELRDHVAALAHDGWRFAASVIAHSKTFEGKALPQAEALAPFHGAVSGLIVNAAHKRGCLALGTLIAASDQARLLAGAAVRAGFDGAMLAQADMVPVAMAMFNDGMPTPNQLYVTRDDVKGGPDALLKPMGGARSEAALRGNIRSSVLYFESWLRGRGTMVIDGAVTDAARAEFRWMQAWQWLQMSVKLDGGPKVTSGFFETLLAEEVKRLKAEAGEEAYRNGRYKDAVALLKSLCLAESLTPGFAVPAMRKLT